MNMTKQEFNNAQEATERALGYYDTLRQDGKGHTEALVHVSLRLGIRRDELSRLLGLRSVKLIGHSGETVFGTAATPQLS